MNNVLEYKGYWTVVEYSVDDKVLHGRIEGIRDFVNFEAESIEDVEKAFHEAVDDYLLFCEDHGTAPEKPYSGSFNVRIPKTLHRAAVQQASMQGISLNQWITVVLQNALSK